MNKNLYGTKDGYEAAFVELTTGLEPTIPPATAGWVELQFEDCPAVVDAVRQYHSGANADCKRFSRIVERNFTIIRSYRRGGRS